MKLILKVLALIILTTLVRSRRLKKNLTKCRQSIPTNILDDVKVTLLMSMGRVPSSEPEPTFSETVGWKAINKNGDFIPLINKDLIFRNSRGIEISPNSYEEILFEESEEGQVVFYSQLACEVTNLPMINTVIFTFLDVYKKKFQVLFLCRGEPCNAIKNKQNCNEPLYETFNETIGFLRDELQENLNSVTNPLQKSISMTDLTKCSKTKHQLSRNATTSQRKNLSQSNNVRKGKNCTSTLDEDDRRTQILKEIKKRETNLIRQLSSMLEISENCMSEKEKIKSAEEKNRLLEEENLKNAQLEINDTLPIEDSEPEEVKKCKSYGKIVSNLNLQVNNNAKKKSKLEKLNAEILKKLKKWKESVLNTFRIKK